jgi:hypothetical protein
MHPVEPGALHRQRPVAGARREDEVVVGKLGARGEPDAPASAVDRDGALPGQELYPVLA